jgi:hypothetical protein
MAIRIPAKLVFLQEHFVRSLSTYQARWILQLVAPPAALSAACPDPVHIEGPVTFPVSFQLECSCRNTPDLFALIPWRVKPHPGSHTSPRDPESSRICATESLT